MKCSFSFMNVWTVHNLACILHTIQCFMGDKCAWITISAILTSFLWFNISAYNFWWLPNCQSPFSAYLVYPCTIWCVASLCPCMTMRIQSSNMNYTLNLVDMHVHTLALSNCCSDLFNLSSNSASSAGINTCNNIPHCAHIWVNAHLPCTQAYISQ